MNPSSLVRIILLVAVGSSACAHAAQTRPHNRSAQLAVLPPKESASPSARCDIPSLTPEQHISQHGTVLERYQLEGGVWLQHAPILVNRDFDFALAMSLEDGLGAGLAAAKRKKENEGRAAELAALVLPESAEDKLAQLRCRGIYVYFLLWEGENPGLRTVIDSSGSDARVIEAKRMDSLQGAMVDALSALEDR